MGPVLRRIQPLVAIALLALAACGEERSEKAPPPAEPAALTLRPVSFAELPGWDGGRQGAALAALARSCRRFLAMPADRALGNAAVADLAGTAGDWQPVCRAVGGQLGQDDVAARRFLEDAFVPFAVVVPETGEVPSEGLFTGYFEAELNGSRAPTATYSVPLHGRPVDLVEVDLGRFDAALEGRRIFGRVNGGRLQPYPERKEILDGGDPVPAPVVVWVDDPVDAFFLHIQGSGRVIMDDGSVMRVGYDGTNGRPFVSIGRKMLERGLIDARDASMQSMRRWMWEHPEAAQALMNEYPRYTFFREVHGEGPIGAFGVPLTPGYSLAVDPEFIPLGVPLWLDSKLPGPEARPLRRLLVAQDTGGAIKGPVRGDVFWGAGEAALEIAGRMKEPGRYYLLLPKAVAERRPALGES